MNTITDGLPLALAERTGPPQGAVVDAGGILSSHGAFEASAEEQKLLCLLADGRLLIVQGQEWNPHVMSYRARLERMGQRYRLAFADVEAIARMYQHGFAEGGRRLSEHTAMQVAAKDLLSKASRANASDIHIRVRRNCAEIYFRIQSDLLRVGSQTREHGERLMATLYGAMASVSDSSYKPTERQDARISDREMLPPQLQSVRIATAPTSEGGLMVLRLLYNDDNGNADLAALGFRPDHVAVLQRLKEQPVGMNIISGPTGSGKSTTLQRVLCGEIAEEEGKLHVITIEDPVEYAIEGAVQTAVTNAGTEEERSRVFSAAIANAMRLDPDTIMIGEIRDRASGQNALHASMTGHQVWTTVHAISAIAIVDRLADLGLPLNMVADHTIVTGLISQRLLRVLCPHCKRPLAEHAAELPAAVLQRLRAALRDDLGKVHIRGPGCELCRHQGTVGRTVVAEMILPDEAFFRLVRNGEKSAALRYWRQELGGVTLLDHALEKVAAGIVDPRMAEKVVGHFAAEAVPAARRLRREESAHAV